MATTKTLTPTNQAITISAFTEKPDNRINATNDDKMADAINTLNSNITARFGSLRIVNFSMFDNTTITITRTSQHQLYFILGSAIGGEIYCWIAGNSGVTKLGVAGSATWSQDNSTLTIAASTYRKFMIISDDIIHYALS